MRRRRPPNLAGKVALVTGAAGAIGGATARALAAAGARVACVDLESVDAEKVAAEVGAGARGWGVDVSDHTAFVACLDAVEAELGPVDVLANVAGVMPIGPFQEESTRATDRIIDVNLRAVIHATKEAAGRMVQRRRGHIVNVASGAAWIAGGGGATYCASKFGVLGYSEAVALELRGSGVEITVIAPAIVTSQLSTGLGEIRGARVVTAAEVAGGVMDALADPRFAVFVPKSLAVVALAFSGLPYGLRHRLERVLKTDKLLLDVDMTSRAAYEASVRRE